jgi:nitroimidazol reductase NimA-like FMN-containing flavoprotein (pyridoxamine 5'-phosphate oxidase superfamily)
MYVKRANLHMSADEIDAFLGSHAWGRLASVSAEGEPHVAPIGYIALDRRVYFHGLVQSRRGRDLAGEPRVALCVDDGVGDHETYSDRRGVVVYGTCRTLSDDDEALVRRVRGRFAMVFFEDPSVEFERRTHAWYEIAPYRFASWDFAKIPIGADRQTPSSATVTMCEEP